MATIRRQDVPKAHSRHPAFRSWGIPTGIHPALAALRAPVRPFPAAPRAAALLGFLSPLEAIQESVGAQKLEGATK